MKTLRFAAICKILFCDISQTVLYLSFTSVGISGIFWTDPFSIINLFFKLSFQTFNLINSFTKCLLITINSPPNVLREYKLVVNGSNASLFPKICAVDAVGIGATNNEFLTPLDFISFLKDFQSQRPDKSESFLPHISYWKTPFSIGDPTIDSYGPNSFAKSLDDVNAAK